MAQPASPTPGTRPRPSPLARWRQAPRRHRLLAACALVAVLVVAFLLLFDWNMLKHPIERRVSAATGREFHIDGDLSVKLGINPRITVEGLRLGNLPGAAEPLMASADRLQLRLHLVPLVFHRDVVLSEVSLSNPTLLLEHLPDGRANWVFPHGKAEWPTVRDLQVGAGSVRYRDPARKTDLVFEVRSGERGADARAAPLVLDGKGLYTGSQVVLGGRIDSPLRLKDPNRPY